MTAGESRVGLNCERRTLPLAAQSEATRIAIRVRHDTAEVLAWVGVDGAGRAGVEVGLLFVVREKVAIRVDGEFQELGVLVVALLVGPGDAVSVAVAVRVARLGLGLLLVRVTHWRSVDVALGLVLADGEVTLGVLAPQTLGKD